MSSLPPLDEQDENVAIAVQALGSMSKNNSGVVGLTVLPPSSTSVGSSPSPADKTFSSPHISRSLTPRSGNLATVGTARSAPFSENQPILSRLATPMSQQLDVESAERGYELTTPSPQADQEYGSEMMESSMKLISRPVSYHLAASRLDEYGVDRKDRFRRLPNKLAERPRVSSAIVSSFDRRSSRSIAEVHDIPRQDHEYKDAGMHRERPKGGLGTHVGSGVNRWREAPVPVTPSSSSPPPLDRRPMIQRKAKDNRDQDLEVAEVVKSTEEFGEDNIERIRYCLEWLQYATASIEAQILVLRNFIIDEPDSSESPSEDGRPPLTEEHMKRLSDVRRDIVGIIRQVVDIVSKHAGSALPGPARDRVRGLILTLPQRWASKAGPAVAKPVITEREDGLPDQDRQPNAHRDKDGSETASAASDGSGAAARKASVQRRAAIEKERGPSAGSRASTPSVCAPSPSISLKTTRTSSATPAPSHQAASGAASKILTLATESLEMMKNIMDVMEESLNQAEQSGRSRQRGEILDSEKPLLHSEMSRSGGPDERRLPPLPVGTSSAPSLRHRPTNHERHQTRHRHGNGRADDLHDDYEALRPPVYAPAEYGRPSRRDRSPADSHPRSYGRGVPYPPPPRVIYSYAPYSHRPSRLHSSSSSGSPSSIGASPPAMYAYYPPTHPPPVLPSHGVSSGHRVRPSRRVYDTGEDYVEDPYGGEDDYYDERRPRYDQSRPLDSRSWESDRERRERERQARLERDQASRQAFWNEYQYNSMRRGGYPARMADVEVEDDGEESEEEGRRMEVDY